LRASQLSERIEAVTTQEHSTCGQGLAENSVLPEKIGSLIAAMAKNLELHMNALDLTDPDSRAEYAAYEKLAKAL
jgi:hypothetical protein